MSIKIKKAEFNKDFEFIFENVISFYKENPEELLLASEEKIKEGVKKLFQDKDNFYYIPLSEKNKVGVIQILKTGETTAEIILVYLKKEYRNKKIGEKTLLEVIDKMKKRGIKIIKTEINIHNKISKHFFEKQNFKKHSYNYLYKIQN